MTSTRSITPNQRSKRHTADDAEAHYEVQVKQPKFTHDRSDDFFASAKLRSQEYLNSNGYSRYGGTQLIIEGALIFSFSISCYLVVIFGDLPTLAALFIGVMFGVSALLFALTLGHDAVHKTLVRNRTINDIVQTVTFGLIGADSFLWKLRHIKSHHISPNVDKFDVDVSENGFIRMSPLHQLRWYHRFQHIYANFVYGLIIIHTFIYYDLRCLVTGDLENVRVKTLSYTIVGKFILEKSIFVTVMFIIPYLLMDRPWWHIVIGAFIVSYINSIIFSIMLIGTHHSEGIQYPTTDEQDQLPHGWAYHQTVTAIDWLPSSKLANFISGGSNTHIAHHLFSNISHIHYVEISKIIKEEAERFDIPYRETSFLGMVVGHYRHLKRMGANPVG